MREANAEISEFNEYAAEQHARLADRFDTHVKTLNGVHTKLHSIFKRVRTLRGRLIDRYPHLADSLKDFEAAREAALEHQR